MVSATYDYSVPGTIGITDANGATTEYQFTDDGSLLQVTDTGGNPLTFAYDEQGNVTEIAYVDGTFETFVYDEFGQTIQQTERSGDTFQFTYDQQGRLIQKTFDDGTFEEFTYDSRSNLTSIKDVNGDVTTITRDDGEQITKIEYPNGRFLSYTYDKKGRKASLVDSNGFEINYSYDDRSRLIGLTDNTGATLVTYEYDAIGRVVQETNGNGTFTIYEYDEAGQLTDIINYESEGVINSSFSYSYDNLGQRIGEENSNGSWTYEYDAIGQLTRAQFESTNPDIADRDLQYVYDAEGNRVQTIINGETTDYTSNNLNQYLNVGDAEYTYDADGNLIEVIDGDDIYSYTYNDENHIIRTETPDGVWEYEYDAFGNRTAVIQDGVRTEYLVDPFSSFSIGDTVIELDSVVGEYDENGELITNYAHGLGLVGRFDGDSAAYFDSDAIGSINGLTDESGGYVNQYAYEPFGKAIFSVENINNPFEFVGELGVMNDSSELSFMRARQYDPITGRFTSTDPLGLDGGDTNLYQYGLNNPLSFVDPNGEFPVVAIPIIIILIWPTPLGDGEISQQTDPLVLDLNGDGIKLISLNQSRTFFDTNANGFREFTSWISADDGLLVLDANNDGQINDISELFGNSSTNGFDDLAILDNNSDNVIDAEDAQFNNLRIWIDRDEDGLTDTGELRTLAQWNIQSISLDRTDLNGNNSILSTGNFTLNNGRQSEIAAISLDVSFVTTVFNEPVDLKTETQFLPNLRGFGQLPNLDLGGNRRFVRQSAASKNL